MPGIPTHGLQTGNVSATTVEADILRAEPLLFGRSQHRNKLVVFRHLGFVFFGSLVQIAGQAAKVICPHGDVRLMLSIIA